MILFKKKKKIEKERKRDQQLSEEGGLGIIFFILSYSKFSTKSIKYFHKQKANNIIFQSNLLEGNFISSKKTTLFFKVICWEGILFPPRNQMASSALRNSITSCGFSFYFDDFQEAKNPIQSTDSKAMWFLVTGCQSPYFHFLFYCHFLLKAYTYQTSKTFSSSIISEISKPMTFLETQQGSTTK